MLNVLVCFFLVITAMIWVRSMQFMNAFFFFFFCTYTMLGGVVVKLFDKENTVLITGNKYDIDV